MIDSNSCNYEAACYQASAEIGDNSCHGPDAWPGATGVIGDCANNTVFVAACDPVVTSHTDAFRDGVSLVIDANTKDSGGRGNLVGGRVHSPSGAPDLFFRADSTPEFSGALESSGEWAFVKSMVTFPYEGAVDGSDTWIKVIRDSDGAVSWAQCVFDFSPGNASDPILLDIPLSVSVPDGRDFPLAQAIEAVPEPGFALLLGVGVAGLGVVGRRKAS